VNRAQAVILKDVVRAVRLLAAAPETVEGLAKRLRLSRWTVYRLMSVASATLAFQRERRGRRVLVSVLPGDADLWLATVGAAPLRRTKGG
jgi:hypothetical protein